MSTRFHTKAGKLTAYAFACGYVETGKRKADGVEFRIWQEHGAFHIVLTNAAGWRKRLGTSTITKARKLAQWERE